jgi:prepilin-type N-terminal cleavage/methylation domain-containing protein
MTQKEKIGRTENITGEKTHRNTGFTIIEVVLVLAIAGLIFLIVFLAVPALQRAQRDTQRRNDATRFISQISQYQSNNRGKVPTAASEVSSFVSNYLLASGDTWAEPTTGTTYSYSASASPSSMGSYYYATDRTCDGENVTSGGGARKVVIQMKLEGAGWYCVGN